MSGETTCKETSALGRMIREKRVYDILTQEELAKMLGIPRRTVSACENGNDLSAATVAALASWLGIDTGEAVSLLHVRVGKN